MKRVRRNQDLAAVAVAALKNAASVAAVAVAIAAAMAAETGAVAAETALMNIKTMNASFGKHFCLGE